MPQSTARRTAALPVCLALLMSAASGQGPPADASKDAKEGKGKWVPLFQRHANEYVIRLQPEGSAAQRLPDPVLRWWQPIRGGDDGALYLWTQAGRPVAAVTFFTFKFPDGNRCVVHERHSFVQGPLDATWRGKSVWRTSGPGLTFQLIPDAPAPSPTAPARLRQMQALVRDFSAHTRDDKDSTWPLRPLTKPLYRYEGAADGALFALAQGTDPEAFLILEVKGEGKDARWEFAVARFTDLRLTVEHKGREVFSSPHDLGKEDGIYHTVVVLLKPSDDPKDFD